MKPYVRRVSGQHWDYESPVVRSELNYNKSDRRYTAYRFRYRPNRYKNICRNTLRGVCWD